jgi:hypothetical protein
MFGALGSAHVGALPRHHACVNSGPRSSPSIQVQEHPDVPLAVGLGFRSHCCDRHRDIPKVGPKSRDSRRGEEPGSGVTVVVSPLDIISPDQMENISDEYIGAVVYDSELSRQQKHGVLNSLGDSWQNAPMTARTALFNFFASQCLTTCFCSQPSLSLTCSA